MRVPFICSALLLLPIVAFSGPNEGGVLVVHDANLTAAETDASVSVCGQGSIPDACSYIDTELDGSSSENPKVWVVYAAFPDTAHPRLMGVSWGIHYSPSLLAVVGYGECGDFEVNDSNWPATDTGSQVTWNAIQSGLLTPVYWFAGYQYSATPATFTLRGHPAMEGTFGDDTVPANLDAIASFGSLGFGTAGEFSCPGDTPPSPEPPHGPPGPNGPDAPDGPDSPPAPQEPDSYEIDLPTFDLFSYHTPATDEARRAVERDFEIMHGGAWSVYSWNPITGTPSAMYGGPAEIAGMLPDSQSTVTAAIAEIRSASRQLGTDGADLRVTSVPRGLGKTAVHFQQTYHGLDVIGGRVRVLLSETGRLLALGSDFYVGISVDPDPSISSDEAIRIAEDSVHFDARTDSLQGQPALRILPVALSPTHVEHHLVWQVEVLTASPFGSWLTSIDAHKGEIIARHNEVCYSDFVGTTDGEVERPSYCEGQISEVLPYLTVEVAGDATFSDQYGNWSIGYGGDDAREVTAYLTGRYVAVNVVDPNSQNGLFSQLALPGEPIEVRFDDNNSRRDERDVYKGVQDVHDFFQILDPEFPYPTHQIPAYVGHTEQVPPYICNAWYTPGDNSISFHNADDDCANTGRILSIVYHEYGHGITQAILGGQGYATQGIGEGNSDILANLMTMESLLARGLHGYNCAEGDRDSDNELRYPQDVIGHDSHDAGRVIAGFQWDAMQLLIQKYGMTSGRLRAAQIWHFGRRLWHPMDQPDQVLATFLADDDDNDVRNGTEDAEELCESAYNHGFVCPMANWKALGSGIGASDTDDVRAVVEFRGDLIAAGHFTMAGGLNASGIARWDGESWQPLGSGISDGYSWAVNSLVVFDAPSGPLLIAGGHFSRAGGLTVGNIAAWDGTAWSSIGAIHGQYWTEVKAMEVYNGQLIVGGCFESAGGQTARNVAKWDGTSWTALGDGLDGGVDGMAIYHGDLAVGGAFVTAGGQEAHHVATWNGVAWRALGDGLEGMGVWSLAVFDNHLFASGSITYNDQYYHGARWDGYEWSLWGMEEDNFFINGDILTLYVYNKRLYAAGYFHNGSLGLHYIAAWDGDAEHQWDSLGYGMDNPVKCLGMYAHGGDLDLVIGGQFSQAGPISAKNIVEWQETVLGACCRADGTCSLIGQAYCIWPDSWIAEESCTPDPCLGFDGAWSPLDAGADGCILTALPYDDGVLVGGQFTHTNGQWTNHIALWRPGAPWCGLASGLMGSVFSLAVYAGNVVAGGYFAYASGVPVSNVAEWDGEAWNALGEGVDDVVYAMAPYEGQLIAGGLFVTAGGNEAHHIAQWNGASWSPLGAGVNGPVTALVVYNGDLIVGGAFTEAGGISANRLARWDGSVWSALGSGVDAQVSALAILDGYLVVGGSFTHAGGNPAAHIAKWDGAFWTAVSGGVSTGQGDEVACMFVMDGKLVAAGSFSAAGEVSVNNIARWDGNEWAPLDGGLEGSAYTEVSAVAGVDGMLVAGGCFTTAGGHPAEHIARWDDTLLGACCHEDGLCFRTTQGQCAAPSSWSGEGTSCYPSPCTAAGGACCHSGGICYLSSPEYCAEHNGTWQGPHSTCDVCAISSVLEIEQHASFTRLLAVPNPSSRDVLILYRLSGTESVTMEIFGVSGALVRRLEEGVQRPGYHSARWDRRDAKGNSLPGGIYFARLHTSDRVVVGRIVVGR